MFIWKNFTIIWIHFTIDFFNITFNCHILYEIGKSAVDRNNEFDYSYKTINELYKGSTVAPLSNNSFFMLYNHPNFTNLDSHEYVVKKLANDSRRYPEVGLFSVGWTITQDEGEKKYDHISSIVNRITPVRMTAFLHNGGCDTISCKLFSPLLQKVFDIIPRVKKLVMIRNTKLSLSEIEKLVKGSSQLEAFSLDGNLVYPDNQDKKELDFDSKLEYKIERFCIHNLDGHLKLISDKVAILLLLFLLKCLMFKILKIS